MPQRLDATLLQKLADKVGKSVKYTREQVTKRATRNSVSSEAYFLYWLKEEGIGIQRYKRSLSADIQSEARTLGSAFRAPSTSSRPDHISRGSNTLTGSSRYVDLLEIIQDSELRDRCADLIKRPRNHDRVFREATTILEHRIKTLSGITQKMNPQPLIGKAVAPDPKRAILVVSSDHSEQEGFFKVCSGIEAAFRNRTHHEISNKLTRYDAIKFCGFIDSLLLVLAGAEVHQERI
ncbi:hypothetical protein HY469_05485 [Candidatus Roizmanbacteria bacterium]|nr:hypothetical protein [Candidatus Roizmanbacteria bacterium]